MKIILSKKGLDSSYGGYPIKMQNDNDDTYWSLITIPIPIYDDPKSNKCMLKGENIKYVCHHMDGEPKGLINLYKKRVGDRIKVKDIAKSIEVDSNSVNKFLIHTDPYIINYSENDNYDYIGSFGQANSAQGHLRKQNVSIGDIFLFYGWYKFNSEPYERQVIFGYLQVDCIITLDKKYKSKLEQDKSIDKFEKDGVCLYFKRGGDLEYYENILENKLANQPHLKYIKECLNKNVSANDTIYIASENLKISIKNIDNKNLKGFGIFEYDSEIENNNDTKLLTLTNLNKDSTKTNWLVKYLVNCCPSWNKGNFDNKGNLKVYSMAQEMAIPAETKKDKNTQNTDKQIKEWLTELFTKCKVKNY